jgi:predicted aldo/keto reductase-like oxidoreductase
MDLYQSRLKLRGDFMSEKKALDRRRFLQSTITGTAGFFLATSVNANQEEKPAEGKPQKAKMIYRTLGKTGLRLPVISMGVMNADNPNLVRAALDAGVVHLDTAWYYQKGENEKMIGRVIKDRPRDSYVIATKVPGSIPLPYRDGKFPDDEVSRRRLGEDFLARFQQSLKDRLKLEYVDILYLHNVWTKEAALHEPLLKVLEKMKKEGKTKFVGISTHRNEPEVIQAAIDSKVYDVVLTAYHFKQDHREEIKAAITKASKAGLGIIGMKTLAGGYMDKEKQVPVNVKAALKWVLQDTNVHTVIPGFTTFDQMSRDLSVMEDLTLTESEKKDLKLQASLRGLYCDGCENCVGQCSKRLPIPDIMRAYMYAYGYRNLEAAQDLLSSLKLPGHTCQDCNKCPVQCAKGFEIPEKILDIARLQKVPSEFIA